MAESVPVPPAVPEQPEDVVQELVELCLAYRQGVRRHPTLYPLIFGNVPGFEPSHDQVHHAREALRRVMGTLERGLAGGAFRGRRVDEMAYQLLALVHGLAILETRGGLGKPQRAKRMWMDAARNLITGFAVLPA